MTKKSQNQTKNQTEPEPEPEPQNQSLNQADIQPENQAGQLFDQLAESEPVFLSAKNPPKSRGKYKKTLVRETEKQIQETLNSIPLEPVVTGLVKTLEKIACRFVGDSANLTETERNDLVAALIPVLKKYGFVLGSYGPEMVLAGTMAAIIIPRLKP
jgi:hypothetical protein